MSEKFSSGTLNPKQTNQQIIQTRGSINMKFGVLIKTYFFESHEMKCMLLQVSRIFVTFTFKVCFFFLSFIPIENLWQLYYYVFIFKDLYQSPLMPSCHFLFKRLTSVAAIVSNTQLFECEGLTDHSKINQRGQQFGKSKSIPYATVCFTLESFLVNPLFSIWCELEFIFSHSFLCFPWRQSCSSFCRHHNSAVVSNSVCLDVRF